MGYKTTYKVCLCNPRHIIGKMISKLTSDSQNSRVSDTSNYI